MTEPIVEVPTTIDVIAPSNLQEGFQFQVDVGGGKLYTVQVPPGSGGVTAGQRFAAVVVAAPTAAWGGTGGAPTSSNVPRGHWRDSWTDCFNKMNAQCFLACCFPPCAVGQIMTRMNLDWKADASERPQSDGGGLSTFKITMIITAAFHIIGRIFSIAGLGFLESVVFLLMAVYVTLITCKTRRLIRTTYSIPVTMCTNNDQMEDCCCSFWCNCCTACHMARHLVDYDQYSAQCCTDTGLGPEAPPLAEFANSANYPPPTTTPQPQANPTPPPVQDEFSRENEKTFVVDL